MKKLLTLVSVGAVACMSVIASINWNSGAITNLAQGATVTVSSKPAEAQNIVDGDNGTGWQAVAATHKYTQDWVLIDLKSEQTFTDMEIVWEASHCKKYSVYVSSTEIPWTAEQAEEVTKDKDGNDVTTYVDYNKIDATWLEAHTAVATSGNDTEAGYTDNISFTEPQKGQYILIYADEYNNFGSQYGMRIFDVRVANIENRDEITELQLTAEGNAVVGGDPVTVTVAPLNKIGEAVALDKVSNLQLTCDNAAVTIEAAAEAGKYNVSASTYGTYTLTATATADGKTVTGTYSLVVAYNWNGTENIATGKTIQGRVKADTEDPNPPANAVDGNLETYYQYNGEWGGGDGWLLVDLGDVYDIDAIGAYYSTNAGGKCVFGYAVNADAVNAKIAEGTDWVWAANDDATINDGWTFTPELARTANVVTTHKFEKTVLARYIVIKDADNPQGKPCVNEIYVSGTKHEAPKADKIEITLEKGGLVIGETNTVTAAVVDQYGEVMTGETPEITVTGAEYANGTITGNAKGMVTVTAKVGELTAEKSFYVADQDDYCLAGCEITASEGAAADKAPVYDGGKDINAWGADYVLAAAEPAGDHTHWFMVKLAKPYNIDLIAALWEGASPADYNIYLGTSENDLTLYYTEKDKAGLQNYSDRFSGKEMNNIQYIKVETTKNATGYGIKLHDFKVYGTSAVESVPTTVEVSASENNIVTGQAVTLSAKVLDQFGAEMEGQNVTYECSNATIEGNTFTAYAIGDYTVTAKCGNATGKIEINVVADANDKISSDESGTIILNGEPIEKNIFYEGEDAGQAISFGTGTPSVLEVDFKHYLSFQLLVIRWEHSCPTDYTVEATYKNGTTATILTVTGRKDPNTHVSDKIYNSDAATYVLGGTNVANLNDIKSLKFTVTGHLNTDWGGAKLFGITGYGTVGSTATAINDILVDGDTLVNVYTIQGIKVRSNVKAADALQGLPHGLYIVGGRKVVL